MILGTRQRRAPYSELKIQLFIQLLIDFMENTLYIELLKKVLVDFHRMELGEYKPLYDNEGGWRSKTLHSFDKLLRKRNYAICQHLEYNPESRLEGKDWPPYADTMIGLKRLENIEFCFREVIKDNIPGDFIETGVWRGGATIFMKALLKAADISERAVWVADSFEGLPEPDEKKYSADKGDKLYTMKELAISIDVVKANFQKYGLLDENVKFLKGWFKDTLPAAPIEKLSIMRLDGDMYESTMDGLKNLYPKLSPGGFIIIDDWGVIKGCKQAVLDYRQDHGITEAIKEIDWSGIYWRKEKER